MTVSDDTIPGYSYVEKFDYIKSVTQFIELYEQKSLAAAKIFLNKYLIFCFMRKKINRIKSIILHLNLDTTSKTRLKCTKSSNNGFGLKIDVSFLWVGVLCNDIDFVKFLLKKNGKYYDDNKNHHISYSFDFYYTTPLFVAVAYTENRDMIDLLIQHGADINTTDIYNTTPLMNIDKNNNLEEYYDFLISRGAKVNLQCNIGKTVLHYIMEDLKFDVALHLIENHGANPYLSDYRNRNAFMMFAIKLNSNDYRHIADEDDENDYDDISIFPFYYEKIEYIEKLLRITRPTKDYVELVYDLFAACIIDNPSLKIEYFNKAREIQNQQLLLFNDNNNNKDKWIKRFNSIVGDDNDEDLYIQSVRVFNRVLIIYDYNNILDTILENVLPFYDNNNKYIYLLIYVLDLVTDNIESYKVLYGETVVDIYERVFTKYMKFVFGRRASSSVENDYYKYFKPMLNKFTQFKEVLCSEKYSVCYDDLVSVIHIFIFHLYDRYYYDPAEKKTVENIIKYEYPINLLTKKTNECILHSIFKRGDKTANNERTKDFLSFLITSTNFKHLNLRSNPTLFNPLNDETPLSLAVKDEIHVDIIKILLDNGSVIPTTAVAAKLKSQYPTLKNYFVTLQSLAAAKVISKRNVVPKHLQNSVEFHTPPKRYKYF